MSFFTTVESPQLREYRLKVLRVALEEWHLRIPEYRVTEPDSVRYHAGGVAGVDTLPLEW
jgi:hypothetical protein